MAQRRFSALQLVVLLGLTALLYFPSLRYGFVYDDLPLIADNAQIRSLGNIPALAWQEDMLDGSHTGYYRPLVPVLDALVYAVFGTSPMAYHAYVLVLHLICTALAYLVIASLLNDARAAFFGAMFFALHPVGTESVVFVTGKNNILSAVFVLGGILAYMSYRKRGGLWRLLLAVGCYGLGLMSKEFAALLPVVLLALDYGYRKTEERPTLKPYALFAVVLVAYMWARAMVLGGLGGLGGGGGAGITSGLIERMAGMPKVIVAYLRLILLPINQRALYDVGLQGDWASVLGAVLIAALIYIAWRQRARLWVGLAVLWIALFLAPVSNILPVSGSAMAERYLYVPMVGAALFVAGAYMEAPEGRLKRAGSVALIILMAVLLTHRMPVWSTDEALYGHMSATTPTAYKGHYNLGNLRYKQGRYEEAARLWGLAIKARPDMYAVDNNLAVLYEKLGGRDNLLKAEARLRGILSMREMPEVRINLAAVLVKLGRTEEARESFERVMALTPGDAEIYLRMASAYESVGMEQEALGALSMGMQKAPSDPRAYNVAGTILGAKGQMKEALGLFSRAVELSPSCTECAYNKAQAQRALDRMNTRTNNRMNKGR